MQRVPEGDGKRARIGKSERAINLEQKHVAKRIWRIEFERERERTNCTKRRLAQF